MFPSSSLHQVGYDIITGVFPRMNIKGDFIYSVRFVNERKLTTLQSTVRSSRTMMQFAK